MEAFEERRIRQWPFREPVVVEEKLSDNSGELFVVDRWCVTGVYRYTPEGIDEISLARPLFDYDTYKILARSLAGGRRMPAVRPLSACQEIFGGSFGDFE